MLRLYDTRRCTMLDINLVRNQPDIVRASMKARRLDAPIDRALELDGQRRSMVTEVEKLKAERNAASKAIRQIKDPAEKQAKIAEQKGLGDKIAALDDQVRQVEAELDTLLSGIPNVLDARVPDGDGDSQNVVIKTVGGPK